LEGLFDPAEDQMRVMAEEWMMVPEHERHYEVL
jgi:hypothetical protein